MRNKKIQRWHLILIPFIALLLTSNFSIDSSIKKIYSVKPLPIETVNAEMKSDVLLYPGGMPVGVKINTKGVLVVAISDVESRNGKINNPAAMAGIQVGDTIIKLNNKEITSASQVAEDINKSRTKKIELTIKRDDNILEKKLQAVKDKDGDYKIGLWIRDSTAGVGTLTFYHKNSNIFGALGHPITDVDTGKILAIRKGQIIPSTIVDVRKGVKGNPGELRGMFVEEDKSLGNIKSNTLCGIFGEAVDELDRYMNINKPLPIAFKEDIKQGPAKIITTLDGDKPSMYDIEIQKLLDQNTPNSKSMVIKITDNRLLDKTGGIVQGMSGSPIIQNGKIVGAVTHVLINKPNVGYGVYIEWMLKDAKIIR